MAEKRKVEEDKEEEKKSKIGRWGRIKGSVGNVGLDWVSMYREELCYTKEKS